MTNLQNEAYDTALAIIGMAGRFPGARNVDEFWQNLIAGVKAIRTFSDEELLAAGIDPALLKLPNYIKAGSILEGADLFDASFFKFSPREAEVMDPQHRLFLECAYEALEDAAYDPERYKGLVGVFAGSAISTYLLNNLAANADFLDEVGRVQVSISNDRDSLASTVSYKLNLRGPSFAVQTFCSTSLVAVHLACQSLLNYDCDIAMAGGVAVDLPQIRGYFYEEGGILSPDGECRTFDASGRGSVMGNGLGVVVLKRLAEAIEEGDQIYAVIRGSHTNNDGSVRVSYTAPGLDGQTAVIAQAISNAQVDPETISYIEAHGTATMLGDAVELAAMQKAFGMLTQKKQFCAIGSVKPNIGHLDRASGVTGLIKTALSLKHRTLPPSLNFEQASPDIDLEDSPFYVNTTLQEWKTQGEPRRAGVSSFGLGGSNAHVVLEEAPERSATSASRDWHLLLLSAKTASALETATQNLRDYLRRRPELNLADVAYTLQIGRTAFNHRRMVVCRNREEAIAALNNGERCTYQVHRDRAVALLFPESCALTGDQMRELYRGEDAFRENIDRCARLLQRHLDLRTLLLANGVAEEGSAINRFAATFAREYALAQMLIAWGIQPASLLGAGIGELVAATVAETLSLEDALTAITLAAQYSDGNITREKMKQQARQLHLQAPSIAYISALTGTHQDQQPEIDYIEHLLEQAGNPQIVLAELAKEEGQVIVEVGDGSHLLEMVKQRMEQDDEDLFISAIPSEDEGLRAWLPGRLWLAGVTLQWEALYSHEQCRRVSLPTYPFERERYWLGRPGSECVLPSKQSSKKADIADWFYVPVWEEAPLPATASIDTSLAPWLIFEDEQGGGTALAQRLQEAGQRVVSIQPGESFARIDSQRFQIRPHEQEDYIALCQALKEQDCLPATVLHLWSVTAENAVASGQAGFQAMQDRGFYSLIFLVQGLSSQLYDSPLRIIAVSNQLQAVTGKETLQPEKATLHGAYRVIPQENLNITCRSIDLDDVSVSFIEQLLAECALTDTDTYIAYRNGARWKQTYRPYNLPAHTDNKTLFREGGVYLITGGLGGVGPVLGEHLARTAHARVVLTSRSALPPQEAWKDWLESHDALDSTSLKIRQLQAIQAAGGEVLVLKADVGNLAQMQAVVQQVQTQFGALHGVIHAAGITTPSAFKATLEIEREECEVHFQPKIYGLYALEQALQGIELDFCLLFSSVSVVLGGLAFSAYVAGNAFMDAFAHAHNQRASKPWLCVNWDTWQVRENAHGSFGATVAEYVMNPAEGAEAFTRVIAHRVPHLINSTGDLHERIQQWVQLEDLQDEGADIATTTAAISSSAEYERIISGIWQQILGVESVGLYDNFFDLGGNSLIALQVISRLKKALHIPIPAVALFEAPTVSLLVKYLLPESEMGEEVRDEPLARRRSQARQSVGQQDIAIIGMSGRFPGASTIEQYWQNLRDGVESITFFSDEELLAVGVDPAVIGNPNFVRARPVLKQEEVENFDAAFFGYSPREAELTDPQHRLFIECSWEALEITGYDPSNYAGLIGVFGGANISTYMLGLVNNPAQVGPVDDYQMVIGNDKDSLTTSVSYKFNLKGPSFAVQTFCSTSLVAVHLGCQSLLHGECDLALAGGVSIRVPTVAGHIYQEGGMESPDGHCRTFDAQAKGSMFGDGVGIVVLKRLQEALDDGDQVLAVIKGSAVNNDGSLKVSYTAPSVVGQAEVVATALQTAGIHPETISYIEAHGTATELGDPIEVASLTKAFRAQSAKKGYCAIGSVKTNIGHLDRAAGVSGLIKTVLALRHREIPASLHYQAPNPEIDFENSPFYVNAKHSSWTTANGVPRRAGINSLGLGGTNAHVIVEEAPEPLPSSPSRPWLMLPISARTSVALEKAQHNLLEYLQQHPQVNLADVAYTLQVGRKQFEQRRMLVCQNRDEAIEALAGKAGTRRVEQRTDQQVSFLFPGVGEQYIGMANDLYHTEATFRATIEQCCAILKEQHGLDLSEILGLQPVHAHNGKANGHKPTETRLLLPGRNGQSAESALSQQLKHTEIAQPAVFVFEYALAQLLIQWGIRPRAMLGYSLGEYVAACLAGVFSLEDALKLVTMRARLIEGVEAGTMVAVMLSEERVQRYLNERINLAIINGPNTCVLAGPLEAVRELERKLERAEVAYRRVETTHAFHTSMLAPLSEAVTEVARSLKLHAPQIPYISNVTGTWITTEQATDPAYWAHHMCQTVRFSDGIGSLLRETEHVMLEVGPGQALTSFTKQHPDCDGERLGLVFATRPSVFEKQPLTQAYLLSTLGKLWLAGVPIDWAGFYSAESRKRLPLPTYPFERQRYWIDVKPGRQPQIEYATPEETLLNLKKEALSDWFYVPGWKQTAPRLPEPEEGQKQVWWLFMDRCGIGEQVSAWLNAHHHNVISIQPGTGYVRLSENVFEIDVTNRADYESLVKDLRARGLLPWRVVHLWTLEREPSIAAADSLNSGFYSLMALAQALGNVELDELCRILVVSNNVQDVTGSEPLSPEKTTLIGPCKVIPQEYPKLSCSNIDIRLPQPGSRQEATLLQSLLGEITTSQPDPVVALRENRRWIQSFEPMHLPEQDSAAAHLREGGVYLITGGLGGIGLAMAEQLARGVRARLVLTARKALPPRSQWEEILQAQGDTQGVGRQIHKVLNLEQLGAEVLVMAADVTDEARMQDVVRQTLETFGVLHGVLHAAGVPGIGLIQRKTPEMAASVMAPKMKGTLVLERVLRGLSLDFLVLFSSITSVTGGGPGQVDYCAANAFMDAFATRNFEKHGLTIAVNWGEWQWNAWEEGLAGYDSQSQEFFRENRRRFGIPFEDGYAALLRILAHPLPRVIVSTQDFRVLAELSRSYTAASMLEKSRQARTRHPRPALASEYSAPSSELEIKIAAAWEDILGIEGIGIEDNFFDLGGNSLIGIELIARLRKELANEDLPSYVLYESPSVAAMARYLSQEQSTAAVTERFGRGERRRANLEQRVRRSLR